MLREARDVSTRKSHKPKHQWKTTEPGNPEPQSSSPATSSELNTDVAVGTLAPSITAKDVPDTPTESVELPDNDSQTLMVNPPPKPKKPFWYRPPDSKARKKFEKIAVMRAAGKSDHDIGKRMDMSEQSVRQIVYLAKMNGWSNADGEPVDLEVEMALNVDRKLVRNLNHALDGGMTNWQTHEVTLELMKRRKVVSDVQDIATNQALPSMVAIQVVMPPLSAEQQTIIEANVGGIPAFQEAEIINGQGALESGQARVSTSQVDTKTI
jgi:hypothetical protein